LEEDKISLEEALRVATEQSQNLRDKKMALEKQLRELEENAAKKVEEMERRYTSLEMSVSQHQREAKEWMAVAECYERTYNQCSAGLGQAIMFLQSVSAGTSLPNTDVEPAG
jgi:septal ring factor EnvC (AmiA/AmiB activator)